VAGRKKLWLLFESPLYIFILLIHSWYICQNLFKSCVVQAYETNMPDAFWTCLARKQHRSELAEISSVVLTIWTPFTMYFIVVYSVKCINILNILCRIWSFHSNMSIYGSLLGCCAMAVYQHFRKTYCLRLQDWRWLRYVPGIQPKDYMAWPPRRLSSILNVYFC
jgi:hypothetical protein